MTWDFRLTKKDKPGHRLLCWWASLEGHKDDRARLRRPNLSAIDLALIPSYYRLVESLEATTVSSHELLGRICIVAAHIRELKLGESFGKQLAARTFRSKPLYSALRMRHLLSSASADQLTARFVTAVHHARGSANLLDLANALVYWDEARLRWARHYYGSTTHLSSNA